VEISALEASTDFCFSAAANHAAASAFFARHIAPLTLRSRRWTTLCEEGVERCGKVWKGLVRIKDVKDKPKPYVS
jgi:hypothetical protein